MPSQTQILEKDVPVNLVAALGLVEDETYIVQNLSFAFDLRLREQTGALAASSGHIIGPRETWGIVVGSTPIWIRSNAVGGEAEVTES